MKPIRLIPVLLLWSLIVTRPLAAQETEAAAPTPTPTPKVRLEPAEDRWRLDWPQDERFEDDNIGDGGINPYKQNTLKGDRPIFGQKTFFVLTGVSQSMGVFRRIHVPTGVITEDPDRFPFFGSGDIVQSLQTVLVSFELFHGETAFKPKDWSIKLTPAFNVNYFGAQERGVVNVDPTEGTTRTRIDGALQEGFAELKLADLSPHFDFLSVRAGIQPFVSDFRGFIFRDTNLGVRLFGNAARNRWQYNVAAFDLLEKETNSDLNTFERRRHQVLIANLYRQDLFTLGYTGQISVHLSRDEATLHYDKNDFLVRPTNIGTPVPHEITALYLGFAGDGHFGRLNVSHAAYWVLGTDERNPIAGREIDLSAQFFALELSIDKDWLRPRLTALFASGDEDPLDDRGQGFDSIFEGLPGSLIAGGPFSFWQRQLILFTQPIFMALTNPGTFLPSLRPPGVEGQANYVNPGLLLLGVGFDLEATPKLRTFVNANYLSFHHPEVLEHLLLQPRLGTSIGLDLSLGLQYRPLLSENIILQAGFAALVPLQAFETIYTDKLLFAPTLDLKLTY